MKKLLNHYYHHCIRTRMWQRQRVIRTILLLGIARFRLPFIIHDKNVNPMLWLKGSMRKRYEANIDNTCTCVNSR